MAFLLAINDRNQGRNRNRRNFHLLVLRRCPVVLFDRQTQ